LGVQILIVVFLSTQQELFVSKGTNTTQLLFKRRKRACRLLMFKNAVLFTTKWSHKEDTHSFEVKEYVGEFKGVVVS